MAYNTFETVDNSLRGEPYGQMTPEGQKLWDEYQNLLNTQKGIPMRNLRLRSGASMQIPDPGVAIKNRMLSKTLGGMTGTGMGTRAAAQPGLFSQLAPLFIAAGIKDPKAIMEMLKKFGIGGETGSGGGAESLDGLSSTGIGGGEINDDWWSNAPSDTVINDDWWSNAPVDTFTDAFTPEDYANAGDWW